MVDASAALSGLLNDGPARQTLADQQIHVPHLVDAEIANALRSRVAARAMNARDAWTVLDTWRRLGMTRYPTFALLDRIWQLRVNVSAYQASYVAVAEVLGCALLTADGRLARAPLPRHGCAALTGLWSPPLSATIPPPQARNRLPRAKHLSGTTRAPPRGARATTANGTTPRRSRPAASAHGRPR